MTAGQAELITRIRLLLSAESSIREVSMFGGRCVMVSDKLVVSALKDGSLLVRVPAGQHDALLERPGATQAEMGTGRTMGPGWLEVSADAVGTDDGLSEWLGVALDHNRAITADRRG